MSAALLCLRICVDCSRKQSPLPSLGVGVGVAGYGLEGPSSEPASSKVSGWMNTRSVSTNAPGPASILEVTDFCWIFCISVHSVGTAAATASRPQSPAENGDSRQICLCHAGISSSTANGSPEASALAISTRIASRPATSIGSVVSASAAAWSEAAARVKDRRIDLRGCRRDAEGISSSSSSQFKLLSPFGPPVPTRHRYQANPAIHIAATPHNPTPKAEPVPSDTRFSGPVI